MNSLDQNYVPDKVEEEVLNHWKKNNIFEKSVKNRSDSPSYSFYDGPPFITGLPHYGHLLGSIVKDVIPRFQTMRGNRVDRVWGWDCHGLPAENKVEQQLGINSKKEIETLGIDKFVAACKNYVNNVSEEWEWYIDRIGRWVDFKNSYRTMDLSYMESVIWVFKQLYDKDLIYKGKRVSLFCPRCSTPISNFEVAMDNSYKDITDTAVYVKFKLVDSDEYLIAWTTTPWTLPSNFALAIDPQLNYAKVKVADEILIVSEKQLGNVISDYKIIEVVKGSKLLNLAYEPLYNYFEHNSNDYKIYPGDFVSIDEGTGVVHIAPGFGEDDTNLGKTYGLTMAESVDEEGHLSPRIKVAANKYFLGANKLIISDLQSRGLLLREEKITHSYPHCHRCGTALLYKAQEAWYINTQILKTKLLKTNEKINWVPSHFKHGRFELGIKNAPDWCISRTRYWGAPIPVWECESCDWKFVAGSIKDIESASGQEIRDLHRPEIDDVIIDCQSCGGKAKRVPEVLDSWVEAASMPYAQRHYPFENEEEFKQNFPADFITEYTGQLRAWFYVMHVISNALYSQQSFSNVIVTGVIMGSDGRKMSKNFGNYPDPKDSILKYGADALRLYLMSSPIVLGEDISISEIEWREQQRSTINILWNSYKFFADYSSIDKWEYQEVKTDSNNPLDRWILARLYETTKNTEENLSHYQIPRAVAGLKSFVNDLSTWYIRRSRERCGPTASNISDKTEAYNTMGYVFSTFFKISAPLIPFTTEYLYRHLTKSVSVHLEDWPELNYTPDKKILNQMSLIRKICELGHSQRKQFGIPVKQLLDDMEVSLSKNTGRPDKELVEIVKQELNINKVKFKTTTDLRVRLNTKLTPELKERGIARDIIRQIQAARKMAGTRLDQIIDVEIPDWPESQTNEIKQKALVNELSRGDKLRIVER